VRINWNTGGHSKYIIKLFVKHFETYNKNKLGTRRSWAEKMRNLPQYEKLGITAVQIKNFIVTQITTFYRAMEKKDSTGFGDLDDITAEDQLIKICKYWYPLMSLYVANFRKELLPVLKDSALINPGAELNSDGVDELSDTASISSNSDLDRDHDGNDSSIESSADEPTNTTSVNDNNSDIEDMPSKKHSKTKSTKKSTKYTPISGRKGSVIQDQFELKRIAMEIKREKSRSKSKISTRNGRTRSMTLNLQRRNSSSNECVLNSNGIRFNLPTMTTAASLIQHHRTARRTNITVLRPAV
jgi:hypothetical protein